jgi:hypothetical protein
MSRSSSVALCAGSACFLLFEAWRRSERRRVRALALELALKGYVKLRSGTGGARKRKAWASFERRCVEAWKKVTPGFELENPLTWPVALDGRAKRHTVIGATTDASSLNFPTRLWDDHPVSLRSIPRSSAHFRRPKPSSPRCAAQKKNEDTRSGGAKERTHGFISSTRPRCSACSSGAVKGLLLCWTLSTTGGGSRSSRLRGDRWGRRRLMLMSTAAGTRLLSGMV